MGKGSRGHGHEHRGGLLVGEEATNRGGGDTLSWAAKEVEGVSQRESEREL